MTTPSGVQGLHHVAIAVSDLDAAVAWYEATLGATCSVRRVLDDQGVEAAALTLPQGEVELVRPLHDDTAVARFIARSGDGLHHIAYAVDDIEATLASLRAKGLRLIDETPRIGLHGVPIAFVHPASCGGVLTELVQTS